MTGTCKHSTRLFAIGLYVFLAHDAFGQAWVKDPGAYYFKVSSSYLFTNEEFDHEGNKQPIFSASENESDAWFRDITINGYLEYGISDDVTLVMNVPFKILTTSSVRELGTVTDQKIKRTNGGLADLTTSVRYPLLKTNAFVTSIQGGVKVPLFYEQNPDNDGPPLGTGEVDLEGYLFAGLSLWPIPAYLSGGLGYRYRGGALHDEIPFSIEGGYTFKRLFAKVRLEGTKNTMTPPDLATIGNNSVVGDQDWVKFMPVVSFRVAEGVSLGGEIFYVVAGRNATAGATYQLGLEFVR